MASVSINNRTRRKAPRLPFAETASAVLPKWDISLVFVEPAEARALNKKLRQKTYTPNVLSYEAGKKNGEILICLDVADREASAYRLSTKNYCLYLFIHGLLHLKGYPHGTTMEEREQELLAKFVTGAPRTSYGTSHRNGNRHRDLPSQDRRRRRNRG